jgi:hypothetical protein
MFHVYLDESCKDTHKRMALGGIGMPHVHGGLFSYNIAEVRKKFNTYGEVKWTKTSKSKLDFYKAFVDVFFNHAAHDEIHFHSLWVDASTLNHGKFNKGSPEIGLNKLMYQLLLHRFGRYYGNSPINVYMDARSAKDPPEEMRNMLNSKMATPKNMVGPFKRINFIDSHDSEAMQVNDLLLGAVGFRVNGRHHLPESATQKIQLSEHIARQVRALQSMRPNHRSARRFSIWDFRFNG